MKDKLLKYRFECYLSSACLILFGTLLFPDKFFADYIMPIINLVNMFSGAMLFFTKGKKHGWLSFGLIAIAGLIFAVDIASSNSGVEIFDLIIFCTSFFFYLGVTFLIIKQVWKAKIVNKNVIFGLISGYISLGFVGFFIFLFLEISHPGSFHGPAEMFATANVTIDTFLYYSFITLLTIGFGDIIPITPEAQKATVFIGLFGQFYMVIITAVVIEKFTRHLKKTNEE